MAQIFSDILAKGVRRGEIPARTQTAREWYRNQAKRSGSGINATGVIEASKPKNSTATLTREGQIGQMMLFEYDPKHKDTLPYYDRFPLIFPINIAKGGFLGMNMHYLPPRLRAQLMDALYDTANNERYDEKTRLEISYRILSQSSKYRLFKPTVKRYLTKHVRSRFVRINASEWDIALFLPLQSFQKGSVQKVYADSRKIIRGA